MDFRVVLWLRGCLAFSLGFGCLVRLDVVWCFLWVVCGAVLGVGFVNLLDFGVWSGVGIIYRFWDLVVWVFGLGWDLAYFWLVGFGELEVTVGAVGGLLCVFL